MLKVTVPDSYIGDVIGDLNKRRGSVMGMTREAMAPMANMGAGLTAAPAAPATNGWDCSCGEKNITGNFCSHCGAKKPAPVVADTWDCTCGQTGITGNFCSNCGAKKPVVETWDCSCGQTGITGNFCSNCGAKKPAPTWNCSCGQTGIAGNFCPNCGNKRS